MAMRNGNRWATGATEWTPRDTNFCVFVPRKFQALCFREFMDTNWTNIQPRKRLRYTPRMVKGTDNRFWWSACRFLPQMKGRHLYIPDASLESLKSEFSVTYAAYGNAGSHNTEPCSNILRTVPEMKSRISKLVHS